MSMIGGTYTPPPRPSDSTDGRTLTTEPIIPRTGSILSLKDSVLANLPLAATLSPQTQTVRQLGNQTDDESSRLLQSRLRPPVIRPATSFRAGRFLILEAWEGIVEERLNTYFIAQIRSRSSGDVESVEIPVEEVSPHDLSLLIPGAVFYWSIGYQEAASGQRQRASILKLRRLPPLSADPNEERWSARVASAWLE